MKTDLSGIPKLPAPPRPRSTLASVILTSLLGMASVPVTGCNFIARVTEEAALAECSPGQRDCDGRAPLLCAQTLTWARDGAACNPAGAMPICSEGRCIGPASIAVGGAHACAVLSDQTVWCWGKNRFGEVGPGAEVVTTPTRIEGLPRARKVAVGGNDNAGHTCALLDDDGAVACWGYNSFGQLGDGTYDASQIPLRIPELSDVIDISLGAEHSCALTREGSALCWGFNALGQAGPSPSAPLLTPSKVPLDTRLTSLTAGALHTCARGKDGAAYCWGDNAYGQTGQPVIQEPPEPVPPTRVPGLDAVSVIRAGYTHTCAITNPDNNATLVCWGRNRWGQVGCGATCGDACPNGKCSVSPPQQVQLTWPPVDLALGAGHTCVLVHKDDLSKESVYCWGRNDHRQLGFAPAPLVDSDAPSTPAPSLPAQEKVQIFDVGAYHGCAIITSGALFCWGRNESGQLGRGPQGSSNAEDSGSVIWSQPP